MEFYIKYENVEAKISFDSASSDANHPDGFFNLNDDKKPRKPGINRRNIRG